MVLFINYLTMSLSDQLATYHPHQPEFHQAVTEVMNSLEEFLTANPKYNSQSLLERIIEPERIIIFRVPRVDDSGIVQINR